MNAKIKIELDTLTHDLLTWTLSGLRAPGGVVPSLEVECLVLMEFERRHLEKLSLHRPPMNITFRDYEALSLHRLLSRMDIRDGVGDVTRNALCGAVVQQLPSLVSIA